MTASKESGPLPRVIADGPLDETISRLLRDVVEVLPWEAACSEHRLRVDGLYTYGHPLVDGAMLDRLPGLKVVSNYGVGVDHIDLAAAAERSIPVGNTPGVLEAATADLGFALLLASARRVVEGDRYARSPEFVRYDPGFMLGKEVHGTTLGIVGLGSIGLQIARRAKGFDMEILYHNRKPRVEQELPAEIKADYVALEELLRRSDFVMLTVPLTDQTKGLIDSKALSLMKSTAILINLARGPVVQTDALLEALKTRQIAGAALDVTDPEPLPRDHGLLKLDNVVITPHLGSASDRTRARMAELSVANLLAGLEGKPLLYRVG